MGPETSRGYTVGVVLEPRWARNLTVAVDYHAMEIDETIGPIRADLLLAGCYSGTNPEYCSRIVRNPVTHFIEVVHDVNGNFGKVHDQVGRFFYVRLEQRYQRPCRPPRVRRCIRPRGEARPSLAVCGRMPNERTT